jgi:DNA-3-methyladenine glycosylase II
VTQTFAITPLGPFSLGEAALFGFGPRAEKHFDGVMRLAFCVDGYRDQVGVELRQDDAGTIHGVVQGRSDPDTIRDQVARILSLDHDARDFVAMLRGDPVLAALHRHAPGLRPVLFHSPYEAALWSILSTRRARPQAAVLRERLARGYGRVFVVAGQEQAAMPTPTQMLAVDTLAGLPSQRLDWLRGVAQAALEGHLDAKQLAGTEPDEAMASLRRLPGIGPFYAGLVYVRATGVTDVLPVNEPTALALAATAYGRPEPLTAREFADLAEAWRPWRTWATVLIRAVTPRLSSH